MAGMADGRGNGNDEPYLDWGGGIPREREGVRVTKDNLCSQKCGHVRTRFEIHHRFHNAMCLFDLRDSFELANLQQRPG